METRALTGHTANLQLFVRSICSQTTYIIYNKSKLSNITVVAAAALLSPARTAACYDDILSTHDGLMLIREHGPGRECVNDMSSTTSKYAT